MPPATPEANDLSPKSIRERLRPALLIDAPRLRSRLGIDLWLVSETFQHTGSFKFRAAYNVASRVPQHTIITASSGNFGQALAHACALLGKSCLVVMPRASAHVKIEAVREFGGTVDLIDPAIKTRQVRVAELAAAHPEAYVASAYDDPLVIEGNSTLGEELAHMHPRFDAIIAPVGGGGLASGIIQGLRAAAQTTQVWGAEPALANDAARSLRQGQIVVNPLEPATLADGARTVSVGHHNWPILRQGLAGIVEVPEEQIGQAVRLLFLLANLKAEPTGALSLAALLTEPDRFRGLSVGCVISGGNVDPALFQDLLSGAPRTSIPGKHAEDTLETG